MSAPDSVAGKLSLTALNAMDLHEALERCGGFFEHSPWIAERALAERQIRREYLALLEGRPPSRTGTIQAPIGRDPRVRTRMAVGGRHARPAETHFTVERELPGTTLVRVRLQTGRTHQIRVHMRAIGHPVCGDPEYGTAGMLGLERQFLHAARISFEHPITGAPVAVSSPLPDDLRAALGRAGRPS